MCQQRCNTYTYIPCYNYKQHMIDMHGIEEVEFDTDETISKKYKSCCWNNKLSRHNKSNVLKIFKIIYGITSACKYNHPHQAYTGPI